MSGYQKVENFCCAMRARFQIGIMKIDASVEVPPTTLADFVVTWEGAQGPTIAIKFCPFCATPIDYSQFMRHQQGQ